MLERMDYVTKLTKEQKTELVINKFILLKLKKRKIKLLLKRININKKRNRKKDLIVQVLHTIIHMIKKIHHLYCVVVPLIKKFDKRAGIEKYSIFKRLYSTKLLFNF